MWLPCKFRFFNRFVLFTCPFQVSKVWPTATFFWITNTLITVFITIYLFFDHSVLIFSLFSKHKTTIKSPPTLHFLDIATFGYRLLSDLNKDFSTTAQLRQELFSGSTPSPRVQLLSKHFPSEILQQKWAEFEAVYQSKVLYWKQYGIFCALHNMLRG